MHKKISIIAISLTLFSLVFAFAKPLTSRAQTPLPTAAEDLEVVQFDNSREDVNETLSDLGITIRLDKPEGAILAFSLPDVYILPDSKLYFVVKFWESLQLLWADTAEEKSDLLFHFSEKRLAETVQLLEEEKSEDAVVNLSRYRGQLSQALSHVQNIKNASDREHGYNRLEEQVWYQRALSRIIQAEGITDIINEMAGVFVDRQVEKGGITVEEVQGVN